MQHRHGTYSSEDTADMLRSHIHGIGTDFESRHQRIRWAGHGEPSLSNLLLPQFVIIGAQKAGTSDMWARMKRRTDIRGPGPSSFQPKPSKAGYYLDRDKGGADKELHWFDHCLGVNGGKSKTALVLTRTPPNATRWCDADDYIRCWPPPPPLPPPSRTHAASDAHTPAPASTARLRASAVPLAAAGEASPSYLLFPELATIMHQIVPDAKLVVLLRDPVARAFSSYYNGRSAWQHPKHLGLRDNDRFVPFEQAVLPELSIIERCARKVPDIAKRFEACIWPEFVVHTLELTLTPHGPWNTSVEYAAGRCSAYYIRKRSLLIRGLYAGQLAAYFEHYPAPEQMLVVSSADYFADPEGVSAQAAAHVLGVGRGDEAGGADIQDESLVARPPIASKHHPNAKAATADRNPTTPLHVAMDSVTETRLRATFAPYNALLYRMLADRGIRFTRF